MAKFRMTASSLLVHDNSLSATEHSPKSFVDNIAAGDDDCLLRSGRGPFIPFGQVAMTCVVSRKHAKRCGKWTLLAVGSGAKKLQRFSQVATACGAKRYRAASGDSGKKPFAKEAAIRHISIVVLPDTSFGWHFVLTHGFRLT